MKSKRKINTKLKVLYQNLNGVWYAFAANGESVFVGKVPSQAIRSATQFSASVTKKSAGRSTAKPIQKTPDKDAA